MLYFIQEMVIKIHLWLNKAIQAGVDAKLKSRHFCMNENGLHHPLTRNMKNKDLTLFINSSTINKKYNKKNVKL